MPSNGVQSRRRACIAILATAVSVALLGWLLSPGAGRGRGRLAEHRFTGAAMGTTYHLTLAGNLPCEPGVAHEAALEELNQVDALMSTYQADSDLMRLNRAAPGAWVAVAAETVRVIEEARGVGERSGGVYDITVGPLVNLWGFGPGYQAGVAPSEAEIEEVRTFVGWKQLEVRSGPDEARRLSDGVFVDLSSIAKGYAVDQSAEALERMGVENYCVEVGGEVRARGRNPRGLPWRIAIESPLDDRRALQRVVSLSGLGMATSGDYRNYFEEGGVRYSHIIDPRTGYPVSHRLASVTVVDPSCMRADAWATALLAAGPDAGFELAEREQLAAFFIVRTRDGFEERQTSRFNQLPANPPP